MKTALFDFDLPADRIALHPVYPRDSSKMLVIRNHIISDNQTSDLYKYINHGDVIVFNNTKVIPALLQGKRDDFNISVNLHRYISDSLWKVFAKPAKRLRVNDIIMFLDDFSAEVTAKDDNGEITLCFRENDWSDKIQQYGKMPLPKYIKREVQEADNKNYQTIYATQEGAVAAPTAGLHFTPELMTRLEAKGAKLLFITLHVGAGTFQPVKTEETSQHIMHKEYIDVSIEVANEINVARKNGNKVIAIGTTSLRALESAVGDNGEVKAYKGETSMFITPGYRFKVVDILLTNFHLPRSTLFMLVCAFMGLERMQTAYRHAIASQYRFYSYGDACLLLR